MTDNPWDSYFASKGVSEYDLRYWKFMEKFAAPLGDNALVLEAGCGSGRALLQFKKSFNVGLDNSKKALTIAKQNLAGTKHALVMADIRKLPFRDNAFGLVYNSGVLEHFPKPDDLEVMSELARVARKGGRVVVIVPNTLCLWYVLGKNLARLLGRWRFSYEGSYTLWGLKKLFSSAGLRVESSSGFQLFPPSHDGFRRLYPHVFYMLFSGIEKRIKNLNKYIAYVVAIVGAK